ncbi:hypothetical protein IW261DRAFT_1577214 [Armillaria novae-zelandiae]|uniref:Uncharacterized protein n=1 Tax=Armillaria novae-zelandiae TaxID=153914 RepID=A0AA39N8A9_9AGAR|nr:hypothetical protein IW261DRAFT_1577214 [Armillaria novae-zelandiae]
MGEIKRELRNQINTKGSEWCEEGKAEIITGSSRLIVGTKPYSKEDIQQFIQIWCQENDAILIVDVASRYIHGNANKTLARKRKADQVGMEDSRQAYTYVMDEKQIIPGLKKISKAHPIIRPVALSWDDNEAGDYIVVAQEAGGWLSANV